MSQMRCHLCHSVATNRCASCKVVHYCTRDHQKEDFPEHREFCRKIKSGYVKVNKEEMSLNEKFPLDEFLKLDLNERRKIMSLKVNDIQQYGLASKSLILALLQIRSNEADVVTEENIKSYLAIDKKDRARLFQFLPGLLLKQNKDQECFDFIVWKETTQMDDCDIYDVPKTRNVNALHSLDFRQIVLSIENILALILIRFRSLSAMNSVIEMHTLTLGTHKRLGVNSPLLALPVDILKLINEFNAHKSDLVRTKSFILDYKDEDKKEVDINERMESELEWLLIRAERQNRHILRAFVQPLNLLGLPITKSPGLDHMAETQITSERFMTAYHRTPGMYEMLKKRCGDFEFVEYFQK